MLVSTFRGGEGNWISLRKQREPLPFRDKSKISCEARPGQFSVDNDDVMEGEMSRKVDGKKKYLSEYYILI